MSNLFTAVSVEQQEIVTGGDGDANNTVTNFVSFTVFGSNNVVLVEQAGQLTSLRNPNNAFVIIENLGY